MLHVDKWKELATRLKSLKEEEANLRRDICAELIAQTEMVNGIATYKGNVEGYDVVAKQSLSFSIDVAALGTIWDELSQAEQDCVEMKPTLKIGPYKKLPEDALLHEAVVTKFAIPTLKAEEPVS